MADALPNLASRTKYLFHSELNFMAHFSISEKAINLVETRMINSWITPLIAYLKDGVLPVYKKVVVKVRAPTARYALINDTLYHRSFSGPYQRCLPPEEAEHIIKQTHKGICNTHISKRSLCHKIMTQVF